MLLGNRSSSTQSNVYRSSSEIKVSITKTLKVSSSGDLEGSFTRQIEHSYTKEVAGYDVSADDPSKWDMVSPVIIPLIPTLMDIISKLPELIDKIQSCGITLFSQNWPVGKIYSGTHTALSGTPELDVSLPKTVEEVILETVTVGRSTDELIVQWWFTVVDKGLSEMVQLVAVEESSRGVKFQVNLHGGDRIFGKTLSLQDYRFEPLRFDRTFVSTDEWGK